MRATGSLTVRQTDFGLVPFSVLGGAMAVQAHVAYSATFRGAAIFAGAAYYCAQGNVALAIGHLELEQRLDRAAERVGVEVVGEVVHPLDDGDGLPVRLVLGGLLDAGVDVADDRLDVADDLAVELHQQPQHAPLLATTAGCALYHGGRSRDRNRAL